MQSLLIFFAMIYWYFLVISIANSRSSCKLSFFFLTQHGYPCRFFIKMLQIWADFFSTTCWHYQITRGLFKHIQAGLRTSTIIFLLTHCCSSPDCCLQALTVFHQMALRLSQSLDWWRLPYSWSGKMMREILGWLRVVICPWLVNLAFFSFRLFNHALQYWIDGANA